MVQPEVVHTTVPVHETHHNPAQHHGTTTLPPVSVDEFKRQGGVLEGNRERTSEFEGCPEGVHHNGCPEGAHPGRSHDTGRGYDSGVNRDNNSSGSHVIKGEGREGSGTNRGGPVPGGNENGPRDKKPSLMDKLNPKKDADNDGKKGMMD